MDLMDWLIVALVVFAASLPFAGADRLQSFQNFLTAGPIAVCALLLTWMLFADGAHSGVWRWLPPFWPWGRFLIGTAARWGLVLLLVVGTVMGIISARFAR
jgi:hypothetical protein